MQLKAREHDLFATAWERGGELQAEISKRVYGHPSAHEPTHVKVFRIKRYATDSTTIIGQRSGHNDLLRNPSGAEYLVALQDDEQRARRAGDFGDLHANR